MAAKDPRSQAFTLAFDALAPPRRSTRRRHLHCLGSGHKQVNLNTLDYIYPLRRLLSRRARVSLDGEINFTMTGLRVRGDCKCADGGARATLLSSYLDVSGSSV